MVIFFTIKKEKNQGIKKGPRIAGAFFYATLFGYSYFFSGAAGGAGGASGAGGAGGASLAGGGAGASFFGQPIVIVRVTTKINDISKANILLI